MRLERQGQRLRGFTLIEVLVVLALLGAASAVAVVAVGTQGTTSAQSACRSDFAAVQTAADSYRQTIGIFPGGTMPAGDTGVPSASGDSAGIKALLGTVTTATGTVGPWMKDNPVNSSHYEIQLSNDGKGTIGVFRVDNPAIQIPSVGSTNAPKDCNSVR